MNSPESDGKLPAPNQKKIDLLMRRMSAMEDFPAVSKHIAEINQKASPRSVTSAIQLANIIAKDYSLTTKLLRIVNSASYGQFSGQISTISRAVVVLGFEQVRLATSGLIFFEHMQNRSQAQVLEYTVLTSFMSGIIARDLAAAIKAKGTEELFLCAMLFNLGKALAIFYFPEEYAEIQRKIEDGLSEDAACRAVFGVTFTEIRTEVSKHWKLPENIIASMQPQTTGAKEKNNIYSLARFSNELCEIALLPSSTEKQSKLGQLLELYKTQFPLPQKRIEQLVKDSVKNVREYSDVLRLKQRQHTLLQSMGFSDPLEASPSGESNTSKTSEPAATDFGNFLIEVAADEPGANANSLSSEQQLIMMNGIQEISNALLAEETTMNELLPLVAETLYHGLLFTQVLIFIKDTAAETLTARYGLGDSIEGMIRKLQLPIDPSAPDLFNRALQEKSDIYVSDTDREQVRALLPAWYSGKLWARSFVFYPINIRRKLIGSIYAGYRDKAESGIGLVQLNYIKSIRNQVVLAIRHKSSQ